eukprot:scaffold105366_cov31-Tisochrysis_lutea.AAC.2
MEKVEVEVASNKWRRMREARLSPRIAFAPWLGPAGSAAAPTAVAECRAACASANPSRASRSPCTSLEAEPRLVMCTPEAEQVKEMSIVSTRQQLNRGKTKRRLAKAHFCPVTRVTIAG